jgi:2-polyprenyl-3-methyl-5-hydroxy-6-metoxy-1,4-benzoquinol methylase
MSGYRKWSSRELADRYQRDYAIDVRPYLTDREITLEQDAQSGVWMFHGGEPGDGPFYEQLGSREEYYKADKWEFDEALRQIAELPRDARLLEIGCGSGAFLDRCRDAGFQRISGLELNRHAVEECQGRGHDVHDQPLEHFDSPASYDCVCAFQVLEHVPDPIGFLRAAAGLLRQGGKLILSTPNADSFLSRYKWCLLDLPPHHMSRWNEASYRKTAELLEMSIDDLRREPLAKYHYRFYANSLVEGYPTGSLRRRLLKPIARIGFAAYPRKTSLAGHSILVVMSHRD